MDIRDIPVRINGKNLEAFQRETPHFTLERDAVRSYEMEAELVVNLPNGVEVTFQTTVKSQDDAVQKFLEAAKMLATLEYRGD